MCTIIDERKTKNIIVFDDIKIGDFFYAQIFGCSYMAESSEQLCLKVNEEKYYCFSGFHDLIDYEKYRFSITEIFDKNNKNKVQIIIK